MTDQLDTGVHRWTGDVHQGDSAEILAEMPESSVHCVVTSPPYPFIRDYGVDGQIGREEFKKWVPDCNCVPESIGGIALDPFAGSGTTMRAAKDLGRRFAGIDLNPEYVAIAQSRVGVTVDEPDRLLEDGETALTAFADGGSHD